MNELTDTQRESQFKNPYELGDAYEPDEEEINKQLDELMLDPAALGQELETIQNECSSDFHIIINAIFSGLGYIDLKEIILKDQIKRNEPVELFMLDFVKETIELCKQLPDGDMNLILRRRLTNTAYFNAVVQYERERIAFQLRRKA